MTGATDFASRGSKKWLQVAVNRNPDLLLNALHLSKAVAPAISVKWCSPLETEDFREYFDSEALKKAGIVDSGFKRPLNQFWPAHGPVWDAIGVTSEGRPIFVEAKAHIPEIASPPCQASAEKSKLLIEQSLEEARRFYAPRATAKWSDIFYQYANRLAHHYFLRQLNGVPSTLVFLYFVNADDMPGPKCEEEWHGAVRLVHAVLGLPEDLSQQGIFDVFLDVRILKVGAESI